MSSKTSSSKNHNTHKFSNSQKANDSNSRSKSNANKDNSCKVPGKNQGNSNDDAKPASVMSNLSSYSLIDDDHIDDQETINVGNLIIDLESDLEKEKIESEQANAKSTPQCTTSNASSSTSSNSFSARASSSTNPNALSASGGKSNQKSNKHSSNPANNSNNSTESSSSNNTATTTAVDGKNGHGPNPRSVFKTSADERGELKMRITRETKPGKSEHKIVTSPNQKSPTTCSSSNNNNNISTYSQANCEESYMSDFSADPTQSSISSTKECGTSTSIGTITEPDCLGPCEPGTSVNLEGIVWQETEGGILVVNVTWRGKTYVGALLDCTKHDWAPPRLCDSPASDIDLKTHKGVRTKRIVTRSNGIGLDEKNLLQTTGKLRNGKGRRILPNDSNPSATKKQKENDKSNENLAAQTEANSSLAGTPSATISESACVPMSVDTSQVINNETTPISNILVDKAGPNSPLLIGCNEPNCSKKFRNMNGLSYHQAHAHQAEQETNNPTDDDCSPSKEKNKGPQALDQDGASLADEIERQSPELVESKQNQTIKQLHRPELRDTPSPQLKPSHRSISGSVIDNNPHFVNEQRQNIKTLEPERRHSLNFNNETTHNSNPGQKSPGPPRQQQQSFDSGTSSNHHSTHSNKFGSNSGSNVRPGVSRDSPRTHPIAPKPPNQGLLPPAQPPLLPVNTEEGMKPSGTSTGPPPAPHQANCYFNSAFLNNAFNSYAMPPYFPRQMFDPLTPPTPVSGANFLNRFMSNVRVPPPPESPSRLLSPSTLAKSLPPFPPMPPLPPMPGASQIPNPPIPGMLPMMGSHLAQPPTSQSPSFPPAFREHFPR